MALNLEPAARYAEEELDAMEQSIGWCLAPRYREFLMEFGGAFVGGCVRGMSILGFFGKEHDALSRWTRAADGFIASGWLPIANDEVGSLFLLSRDGEVRRAQAYGGRYDVARVAGSFDEFLEAIEEDPDDA